MHCRELAINPITAEIVRHGLLHIPKQIELNITRTAYSPLIYEYKDFAVGIVDAQGRLICQGDGGIPLFVANRWASPCGMGLRFTASTASSPVTSSLRTTLERSANISITSRCIRRFTPQSTPSELLGFMCVIVHWVDIGGMFIGSSTTSGTTSIYQEGLQLRSVKLRARGEPIKDMYRIIENNSRFSRELFGDIEAQLAGCLQGRDMFLGLVEKYGLGNVRGSIELMWDRSEKAARAAIADIPNGTYSASSFLDDDGVEASANTSTLVSR